MSNLRRENTKKTNFLALSTAVAARCRNQKMSEVSYRISTILFHSGVKQVMRLHVTAVNCSLDFEFKEKWARIAVRRNYFTGRKK